MTKKRLRLPYASQNGEGAQWGVGDCGLACVTALARAAGHDVSVDNVGLAAGLLKGYERASVQTVKRAASLFGVELAWRGRMMAGDLVRELNDNRAVVLLVWYPALQKKRLATYRDGHFIVVHGYERGQHTGLLHFYYDDPEWLSARQGEDIRVAADALMAAAWHAGSHAKTPAQGLALRSFRLPDARL